MARMGEERSVHRVLVGKPEGKKPLGRPRCRWEDNIKMDLQEVGGGGVYWMELCTFIDLNKHNRDDSPKKCYMQVLTAAYHRYFQV